MRQMKWPMQLTVVRHDISSFNAMKRRREADPDHVRMRKLFETAPANRTKDAEHELLRLCRTLKERYGLKCSDWNTPLADTSSPLGQRVGAKLPDFIGLPHIIYVSPYTRTRGTLEGLKAGWPALDDVKTVEDDRLREQEHGLALLYNDWRIFQTLHPEQREFYAMEGEEARYWYRYPQGENVSDVRERMRSFQATLIREHAGENVLVVTHHLCLLALRANMERWSAAKFIDVDEHEKPLNCGVTIYRGKPELGKAGRLVLDEYNLKLYD